MSSVHLFPFFNQETFQIFVPMNDTLREEKYISYKILAKPYKILAKSYKILAKSYKILAKSYKILAKSYKILANNGFLARFL